MTKLQLRRKNYAQTKASTQKIDDIIVNSPSIVEPSTDRAVRTPGKAEHTSHHNHNSVVTKDDSTAMMRQTQSTNFNLLLTGREPPANPLPDVSEV